MRGLVIGAWDRPAILNGVDFDLMPGEILGVVGLPGSGKSILIRAIVRLLGEGVQARAGHVLFRGKDLAELMKTTCAAFVAIRSSRCCPTPRASSIHWCASAT